MAVYVDDLSTWYLRRTRRRFSRNDDRADQAAAFATLHRALVVGAAVLAPMLPFPRRASTDLVVAVDAEAPESVHLTRWPSAELAPFRDERLERAMATARRAAELARTLRGSAGLRIRQPLARLWLALPGGDLHELEALLDLLSDELNVKAIELIGDESDLVDRRVKPLLPKIGRKLGPAIPAVMEAAREGRPTSGTTARSSWRASVSWRPTRSRSWPRRDPGRPSPTTKDWSSSSTPS